MVKKKTVVVYVGREQREGEKKGTGVCQMFHAGFELGTLHFKSMAL